jgi:hypothetical protein
MGGEKMKKIGLIIAVVLLVALLIACAPVQKEDAADKKDAAPEKAADTTKEKVEEKVVEPAKTKTETKTVEPKETKTKTETKEPEAKAETPKNLPETIQKIVDKADRRTESMVYLYGSPETEGRFLDTYNIRGTKIRVDLYEDNYYVTEGYFDTVYLDTVAKTAKGQCLNGRRCISSQVDNTGKLFDADYDEYLRKTPFDWVKEIKPTAEFVGPEVVDRRSVSKIKYEEGDKTVEMWLDDSYGVPLQLKIIYPDDTEELYSFTNAEFNTLEEKDMVPTATVAAE